MTLQSNHTTTGLKHNNCISIISNPLCNLADFSNPETTKKLSSQTIYHNIALGSIYCFILFKYGIENLKYTPHQEIKGEL